MKKLMTFCLLLSLTLPVAAVEDGQVVYFGGTAPAITTGLIGRLDTASEASLTFEGAGSKLVIPYSVIEAYQYSTEVTHHLGVVAGITVSLIKKRQRRHFFRITYRDSNNALQIAVFEVPKHMPLTLQAILEAHAPNKCKSHCSKVGQD
jgi:hypothetical protein